MEVKGSISQLLKGLENTNISKDSLVGKPVNDSNGNKIGVITKIDIDNDTWYGCVSEDAFEEYKHSSFEVSVIRERKKYE